MSGFFDLAPGETNFIGSRLLTQAEADLLYFPLDGDMGSASFGVSAQEVENAIQAAIQNYQLLGKPEADQIYLSFEADFQPQIQQYQTQLNNLVEQESNLLSISLESLVDSKLIWTEIDDKPARFPPELHAHPWENITDPPTTATRWADWNEVTGKPDFNTLYRQLGVAIDWSEISNPPTFSADWNSITGKPSTYPPSTHGHDWSDITGIPPENGGTVTYNIIQSSTAFVEEFDDFLSIAPLHKLGWSSYANNGWSGAVEANRFPGAKGVFAIGINGNNQSTVNYSALRLGSFPIIPQPSEGYSNIEISSVIGLPTAIPTQADWAQRFGLLDTGAGDGTDFSVLISAEYFSGGYNWVAVWKYQSGTANKQVITPVVGTLSTKLFNLKIKIDCENYKIFFTADGVTIEVLIGSTNWLFGAMSPLFVIERQAVTGTNSRTFYVDKYLYRENVSDVEVPAGPTEVDWGDILNKPTTFPPSVHEHNWGEIAAIPATASRWPTWGEVTSKPTTFLPSAHEHNWEQITDRPFEQYTQLDGTGTTARTWVGGSGEILQWLWRTNGQHEFGIYDYNLDPMIRVVRNTGEFGYRLANVALPVSENLAYSWGSGWSEYSPSYSARYRRLDKLILCQGLVRRTTTTGTLIATLPGGFRPSSRRLFGCQSSQGYTRIDIDTSGQILLASPNPTGTINWLSLDGISFFTS